MQYSDASVPSGAILLWSGSISDIPSGYILCDGNNNTPDLRDRFIIGAGSSYNVGDIGGSASHNHSYGSLSSYWFGQGGTQQDWNGRGVRTSAVNSTTTLPPYYALCYIMKTYPEEE